VKLACRSLSLLCLLLVLGGVSCAKSGGNASAAADDDAADDDDDNDDNNDNDDDNDDDAACWTDLPVGEKAVVAEGFSGTEGIGFSSTGELFVGATTGVAHVHPDGTWEMIAKVTHAVGLAFGPDDVMYVCDFGASSLPGIDDGAMWRLDMDGNLTLLARGIDNPNFVAYTPWDTLLVSDNFTATIYEVTLDGKVSHWIDGPLAPNGMVFTADWRSLYVAGTVPITSPVYRVDLTAAGVATGFTTIAHLPAAALPDGAGLDEKGGLYIMENFLGQIVRIDLADGSQTVVGSGMESPASIAFGRGANYDPCSIYVTETWGPKVWRISLGVHGAPLLAQ